MSDTTQNNIDRKVDYYVWKVYPRWGSRWDHGDLRSVCVQDHQEAQCGAWRKGNMTTAQKPCYTRSILSGARWIAAAVITTRGRIFTRRLNLSGWTCHKGAGHVLLLWLHIDSGNKAGIYSRLRSRRVRVTLCEKSWEVKSTSQGAKKQKNAPCHLKNAPSHCGRQP